MSFATVVVNLVVGRRYYCVYWYSREQLQKHSNRFELRPKSYLNEKTFALEICTECNSPKRISIFHKPFPRDSYRNNLELLFCLFMATSDTYKGSISKQLSVDQTVAFTKLSVTYTV